MNEYEDLFAIDDYPRAYLPYGELLAERGQFEAAKSYLMQALLTENDEHRARAHYKLGLVHLTLGESEFAIQSFRESNRLYPDNLSTLAWLSEAYLSADQDQQAIDSLRRALELDRGNFDAQYKLGVALMAQKRFSEARQHIEAAIEIKPDDDRAREALETMKQLEAGSENTGSGS